MLSAFKNFFVTLLIALVIFGVAAYFASMFVTDTMSSILTNEKEQLDDIFEKEDDGVFVPVEDTDAADSFSQIEGESFDFLLVVTDYRPDLYDNYSPSESWLLNSVAPGQTNAYDSVGWLSAKFRDGSASAILLVRADKDVGKVAYTYCSPETRVYTPTGYHTLAEVYTYYGMDVLSEHICALTGIKPDYTMLIEGYHLDEFVNYMGPASAALTKDIYFDGTEYTTQYEYTREAIDRDGIPYVEHIPYTYTLGVGSVVLDAQNMFILTSLAERSMEDIALKEACMTEVVKQYMTKLASMDDEGLRSFVTSLTPNTITAESVTGTGEAAESETAPSAENNPWWASESGMTSDGAETTLSAPATPIIETEFNTAELEKIKGTIKAWGLFEQVTISYPGTFVAASAAESAYFEPDIKKGIDLFLEYRMVNKTAIPSFN